jgi:hypothetical protein
LGKQFSALSTQSKFDSELPKRRNLSAKRRAKERQRARRERENQCLTDRFPVSTGRKTFHKHLHRHLHFTFSSSHLLSSADSAFDSYELISLRLAFTSGSSVHFLSLLHHLNTTFLLLSELLLLFALCSVSVVSFAYSRHYNEIRIQRNFCFRRSIWSVYSIDTLFLLHTPVHADAHPHIHKHTQHSKPTSLSLLPLPLPRRLLFTAIYSFSAKPEVKENAQIA